MAKVKKKINIKSWLAISGIVILAGAVTAYLYVNRGVSVEIANEITIGEEVTIPSENGDLRGSLLLSEQEQSPAVIMVTGSGANTYRNAWHETANVFWKPLTEMLLDNGYTVLLLEKRGVNGSAGHWEHQSFEERSQDVKDAIDYIKTRENIDANRIGIIGHSQGGWIAQLTSVLYPEDVAFIVNLAGPSSSVIEQVLDDFEGEYITAGLSQSEIAEKLKKNKMLLDFVYAVAPVLKFGNISHIIRYDAESVSRQITVPVFAVYGENDDLVPPDKNIKMLKNGLAAAENNVYEIHTIQGADHIFKLAAFGTPREALQDVETSAEFFDVMNKFILWEQNLHSGNYP